MNKKETIEEIEISKILQKENSRLDIKDKELAELMDSIKQHGLLQPIGIAKTNGHSQYEIAFGNRRFEACKKLGMHTIKCIILENVNTTEDMLTMNLIENLQRKDITILEQGRIMYELMRLGLTESEIAARLSIQYAKIRDILLLYNEMPKKYINHVVYMKASQAKRKGKIPATLAVRILSVAKSRNISQESIEVLLEKARYDNFQLEKLNQVIKLIKNGYSAKDAIDATQYMQVVDLRLIFEQNYIKKIERKHNLPIRKVLRKILSGDIKEKIDI